MLHQDILEILKKYSIIEDSKGLSADFDMEILDEDINESLLPILEDLIPERIVYYPDLSGFREGEGALETYIALITQIIEKSDAKIVIKSLKSKYSEDEEYTIEYKYKAQEYDWTFIVEDDIDFLNGITNWAFLATKKGYIFRDSDTLLGCCLPKKVISYLEKLGFENEIPEVPINSIEGKYISFAAYSNPVQRKTIIEELFEIESYGGICEEKLTDNTSILFDPEGDDEHFEVDPKIISTARERGIQIMTQDEIYELIPDE